MATTEEDDIPPEVVTVADRLGHVWEEVRDVPVKAAHIVYAEHGRSLWPVFLAGVVLTALALDGAVAGIVGAVAVMLLVIWVVARDG